MTGWPCLWHLPSRKAKLNPVPTSGFAAFFVRLLLLAKVDKVCSLNICASTHTQAHTHTHSLSHTHTPIHNSARRWQHVTQMSPKATLNAPHQSWLLQRCCLCRSAQLNYYFRSNSVLAVGHLTGNNNNNSDNIAKQTAATTTDDKPSEQNNNENNRASFAVMFVYVSFP